MGRSVTFAQVFTSQVWIMSQTQSLEDLLSVLGQTIIVVTLGILTRKFNWLPKDTSAISIIVSKYALPAIFFLFSATLDLSAYYWAPICSVLFARIVMILLAAFIAWIGRLEPLLSATGIIGLFVTQSKYVHTL